MGVASCRGYSVGRALKWGVNEVRIRQRAGGGVSLELTGGVRADAFAGGLLSAKQQTRFSMNPRRTKRGIVSLGSLAVKRITAVEHLGTGWSTDTSLPVGGGRVLDAGPFF